ncbi:MAG: substrate-binding domain-containing protein [bacterium]|nr:substrate-binding domain-containing protein [bacterium]
MTALRMKNHIAIGSLKPLKEAGYCIPQDVGIIGFDDLPTTQFLEPPMTTVHVPTHYMGKAAAQRRIRRWAAAFPVKIEIGTALILRKSV